MDTTQTAAYGYNKDTEDDSGISGCYGLLAIKVYSGMVLHS